MTERQFRWQRQIDADLGDIGVTLASKGRQQTATGEMTHLPAAAQTPTSDQPPSMHENPATVVQMTPKGAARCACGASNPSRCRARAAACRPRRPIPVTRQFRPSPVSCRRSFNLNPVLSPHPTCRSPTIRRIRRTWAIAINPVRLPILPQVRPRRWASPMSCRQAPPKSPAEVAAAVANQRLVLLGIMAVISLVHLPWLDCLMAIHGCWGSFLDLCLTTPAVADDMADGTVDPFAFARVAFFILRVRAVLSVDFQQFSQVMQIGTGLGSFALTKIVAANGTVVQGRLQRFGLAVTCAIAVVLLLWVWVTVFTSVSYAVLDDETVPKYIGSELLGNFVGAPQAQAGLLIYLHFLRLADAWILGAALAMPKSPDGTPNDPPSCPMPCPDCR